ncbi:YTH domain-containing family protein 1 [Plecturocebus cupreus]
MVNLKIWDVSSSAVKTVAFVISSVALIGILSSNDGTNVNMAVSKLTLWAAIASKPAKTWPKMERKSRPVMGGSLLTPSIKHNMNIDTWDNKGPVLKNLAPQQTPSSQAVPQPLKVP